MDYWHKKYTCPFFVWDDQTTVGCEGGKLKFPDVEAAVRYMDGFCAARQNGWKECSIAACLLKYYEDQEE